MNNIKKFILSKKPHVIVVGGESREAMTIVEDLKQAVNELMETDQLPMINVELMDNELAVVFMNSNKAEVSGLTFKSRLLSRAIISFPLARLNLQMRRYFNRQCIICHTYLKSTLLCGRCVVQKNL